MFYLPENGKIYLCGGNEDGEQQTLTFYSLDLQGNIENIATTSFY
jgi:hypothetical protein